ncbi:MAG: peptide deformylase, partial [Atopobiaceae bacterium]|nr:peptide deformylase [Atopobiaceae bacterium]
VVGNGRSAMANMVGIRKRIIAIDDNGTPRAMLNPEIVEKDGPYEAEEGCLSLPGRRTTTRFQDILLRWQDTSMTLHEERFSGWTAQIIQHEVDHCNRILI